MAALGEGRPYRSHQQPACMPCRKRKSRCKLGPGAREVCLMCEVHGTSCVFPGAPRSPRSAPARRAQARANNTRHLDVAAESSQEVPFADTRPSAPSSAAAAAADAVVADAGEAHVVGPVHSPDAQLITSYLTRQAAAVRGGQQPVMFNTVRRHPLGRSPGAASAAAPLDVIEKLLEPHLDSLLDVYFTRVHPCYPVLDERAFRAQYTSARAQLSPALLANLYAQSLPYWRQTLPAGQHCPNVRYVWNQANEALYRELYQAPSLSTIAAILLNISGRPLSSMMGNAVLLGAAISLAHCLGLNRSCLGWNISAADKAHRTRLWWAIVIYDKWSSVAYGTPPRLQAGQHDVAAPTLDIVAPASDNSDDAASIFIALVGLTDVLDVYLAHVFDLDACATDPAAAMALSTDLDNRLAHWTDSLPHDLRRVITRGVTVHAPGSANLRLSYLYLRLLSRRIGLLPDLSDREQQQQQQHHQEQQRQQLHTRQAAEDIVIFVQELDSPALADFWLSFNAFALSSTAAFLLRSALQQQQQDSEINNNRRRDDPTGTPQHHSRRRLNATTAASNYGNHVSLHSNSINNAKGGVSSGRREHQPSTRNMNAKNSRDSRSRDASKNDNGDHGSRIYNNNIYIKLAVDLMTALEKQRKEAGWDLANICIAQYASVVEQLQQHPAESITLVPPSSSSSPPPAGRGGGSDVEEFGGELDDGSGGDHQLGSNTDPAGSMMVNSGVQSSDVPAEDNILLQQHPYQEDPYHHPQHLGEQQQQFEAVQQQFDLQQQQLMPFAIVDGMYMNEMYPAMLDNMFGSV